MFIYRLIATFFGIGYIGKGAGTIASIFVGFLLYLGAASHLHLTILLPLLCVVLFVAGVIAAGKVERSWGKDNKRVVVDEVMGMAMSFVFLPINLVTLSVGLLLFRFFDIRKPLYIRKMEDLKGGWGVMMDDLLAGLYSNIILQGISYFITNYYETIS
jgi:phosphatidylglycerophosphatase A